MTTTAPDTEAKQATKKRTLLQIADDMQALCDLLDEAGGDISDEQVAEYIDQMFGELGDAFNKKVDGYVTLIREMELVAAARKEEAQRLSQAAKTSENKAKWLKNRLMFVMDTKKIKKAGHVRSVSIVNNGGKLPVDLSPGLDPKTLPPRFQKVTVDINKDAIYDALNTGEELEFASLGVRGKRLSIK